MPFAKVFYVGPFPRLLSSFFFVSEISEQPNRKVATEEPNEGYKHDKRRNLHCYNVSRDWIQPMQTNC